MWTIYTYEVNHLHLCSEPTNALGKICFNTYSLLHVLVAFATVIRVLLNYIDKIQSECQIAFFKPFNEV